MDIETDEGSLLVGVGLYAGGSVVYCSQLSPELITFLNSARLIGHSIRFDIRKLNESGCGIQLDNAIFDTRLAQYVIDSTKQGCGLKSLAAEYLGYKWPTYKEMVGSGKSKLTLDKQPIEKVAKYCGMDALATYKLAHALYKKMSDKQREYFNTLEMPLLRVLYKMESRGVQVDLDYLKKLDDEFTIECNKYLELLGKEFNPRSPKQVLKMLKERGINVPSTDVKYLKDYKDHEFVSLLLRYREFEKLRSTYTDALLKQHRNGRIFCEFKQTRTVTGRLASANPNLQNIPVRSELGEKLRHAFVAPEGKQLVVADYSQIEYRLLAHFSQEPVLLEAFNNGKDVHEETACTIFGKTRVEDKERALGKTLNFAAIYGAGAPKIAATAGISVKDAAEFLSRYWQRLPRAADWIAKTKWEARKDRGVSTMFGRWIPLPGIASYREWERGQYERYAISYRIQGSAAEIMKKALIALSPFDLVASVHDEVIIETDGDPRDTESIHEMLEEVVPLSVPLEATIAIGANWGIK